MAALKCVCAGVVLALAAAWVEGASTTTDSLPNNQSDIRQLPRVIRPQIVDYRPFFPRSCPVFSYDAVYDLQNNIQIDNPNVVVINPFTGTGCSQQGVLKLVLSSKATRRRVLIDLFFHNPTNWVFNLGDSSTNNGYAGDAGNQRLDAEVQGTGTKLTGYLNDNGGSLQAFSVPNLFSTRLSLLVSDGHIIWIPNDNNNFNYYYNINFFALNGQFDPDGPVNYDLYLGLNRVVASSDRYGSGLCKVGIKFLPEF